MFFPVQNGKSPLHRALKKGHISCVKVLLENSADINLANKKGQTPLMVAAEEGYLGCVRVLIQKGADINQVNPLDSDAGITAPMMASSWGNAEVIT